MDRSGWVKMEICRRAIILVLSLHIFSCSSFEKLKDPEVKVTGVNVTDVGAQDLSVDLKLNIKNPNARTFSIGKIVYGLSLSGQAVTEGTYDKGIELPAEGATDVTVPLKFKYASLNAIVNNFLNKTLTKDYILTGTVDFGPLSIPFNQKGTLKLGK